VRKIETNIPLRRPKHRWEDNFKMDLRENRWGGKDRIPTFDKPHIKIR
jgi:hypothetical protein